MMTQNTNGATTNRPCLEYHPRPGGARHRVVLDPLPFTLGRMESVDLQIDSTQVSRAHARISLEDGHYVLRDLESTNGTYVNGQQINSVTLSDGDTLMVADFELRFVAASGDRIRSIATRKVANTASRRVDSPAYCDAVDELRRMHEVLLNGLVFPEVEQIARLPGKEPFAVYAVSPGSESRSGGGLTDSLSYSVPSHPSVRYHELYRAMALDHFRQSGGHVHVMVDVETWEVETNGRLARHLAQLADLLCGESSLIVAIAADAAVDVAEMGRFHEQLRQMNISVCFRDFIGGGMQIAQYEPLPPDYLLLGPSMMRAGLRHSHQHQKLKSVVDACRAVQCRPIFAGVDSDQILETCHELGFDLIWESTGRKSSSIHTLRRKAAGVP